MNASRSAVAVDEMRCSAQNFMVDVIITRGAEQRLVFTRDRDGYAMRANVHHVPWPLEEAEADIERNDLAAAVGIRLPNVPPVLHYSRRLAVYVWQLERVRSARERQRIPVAAVPST